MLAAHMFALGHKRTFGDVQGMSAYDPMQTFRDRGTESAFAGKADIGYRQHARQRFKKCCTARSLFPRHC